MKPVSFTHSGTVGAPLERVFALLTDPARIPEWLPGCSAVAPKDRPLEQGAKFHFELGGPTNRVEVEIIDYQPPTAFGWVELRRRAGNKTFFKLQFSGGETRLTIRYVWAPPHFRSWLLGQFYRRRDAWRMFNGTLQNLRKVLTR